MPFPSVIARRDIADADGDPSGGERHPVHRVAHADRQGLPGMGRKCSNLNLVCFGFSFNTGSCETKKSANAHVRHIVPMTDSFGLQA